MERIVPPIAELFQFTPLREGRLHVSRHHLPALYFNSRPSARGDPYVFPLLVAPTLFQFTPLREGRLHAILANEFADKFQFTPLREGRPTLSGLSALPMYFNSRPSARGDGKRYAISANLLFNPYKSAWLNNSATQFVEIILVIFHRIIA